MKILVVDDEIQLANAISTILTQNKYFVDTAFDGENGLEMALTGVYDLIILDIMMPKINGLDVLKILRNNKIKTPVLILSAKNQTADKIVGLNVGADDYMTKPFDMIELLARVKALLRRNSEFTTDEITFGDLTFNINTFELSCGDKSLKLGKKEYQIMEIFFNNPKKTIYKERFIEKIWGYETEAEYNTIEVYVSFLRKKLLALGSKVQIKSIRGIGYILENG
ncbi:MAG: response regulator transcription factor [Clostridiales bacterium]|nr:response regulator transcription factor [Clostridiales bacterium]